MMVQIWCNKHRNNWKKKDLFVSVIVSNSYTSTCGRYPCVWHQSPLCLIPLNFLLVMSLVCWCPLLVSCPLCLASVSDSLKLFVVDVVSVLLMRSSSRHPWEKLISLKQLSQLSSLCIQTVYHGYIWKMLHYKRYIYMHITLCFIHSVLINNRSKLNYVLQILNSKFL